MHFQPRRRGVAAIASASLATIALAGCGGSGDKSDASNVVKTYLTAVAAGDGTKACAQLTGREARSLINHVSQQVPELHANSCASAVHALSGSLGGDDAARLRAAKIRHVAIHGKIAIVHVAGATSTAYLTKTGGHWYIAGGLF